MEWNNEYVIEGESGLGNFSSSYRSWKVLEFKSHFLGLESSGIRRWSWKVTENQLEMFCMNLFFAAPCVYVTYGFGVGSYTMYRRHSWRILITASSLMSCTTERTTYSSWIYSRWSPLSDKHILLVPSFILSSSSSLFLIILSWTGARFRRTFTARQYA